MKINDADRESIRTMRQELREIENWLCHANGLGPDYAVACERAIELRKRLGLPEPENA